MTESSEERPTTGAASPMAIARSDSARPCNWLGMVACSSAVRGALPRMKVKPLSTHQATATPNN